MKWEYLVISVADLAPGDAEKMLNVLGERGWELVAVTGNNTHRAYLKRRTF